MLNKVPARLSPECEAKVYKTIGCALRVHKALGPGFREGLYHDAMRVELSRSKVAWRSDLTVDVYYEGQPLRKQTLDLVVDDLIVLELKAVDRFHPIHAAQILSYMKAAGLPVGLLMNFQYHVAERQYPPLRVMKNVFVCFVYFVFFVARSGVVIFDTCHFASS